ncbi:MAG: AMP-binding protein [Pyrinomonadaceae bacterium]|nr:AMP-binding protein [Pyrinomonadaceae bacterium]
MNDNNLLENQPIAWTPTEDVIEHAQLTRFMKQVGVSTFDELYQFSINNVEKFTAEVLKFLDIKFKPPYEKLLDTSDGAAFPQWCAGAGLNIVSHCVDRWQTDEMRDQPAIIWEGEEGKTRTLTYAELMSEVEYCSASLRQLGLTKGDAIGIHMPMVPETVIALLSIGRIGAIAVPVFSGYGIEAIVSRLKDVKAKALFTCDGFPRRGKFFKATDVIDEVLPRVRSIKRLYTVPRNKEITNSDKPKSYYFEWLDSWNEGEIDVKEYSRLEPTNAEDPLIILYTSGTTGKPKGIAHSHLSFPIKAAQDMAFGTDVGKGTRISWITDIGWMMGPWLIYGALLNGATMVLYDGAPDFPKPDRMWEFCAKHKVEIFGISPTLVRALATHGDDLPKKHDLSSLRAFASTGEPWNPAPWWWLFEKVGDSKLPIINYSGGTEISGGILMNNPLLPIKPCGFSAPCPGMDADILNDQGESVGAGEVGELVIKKPWIGMARGFWQERERYLETYWSRFENVWVHGDWAMRDADGHYFILGRSDDTLKIAGKRVGPAEVESILVAHPLVVEAAVIGIPDEMKGTAMVAFCVLTGGADGSSALSATARDKPLPTGSRIDDAHNVARAPLADEPSALQLELKNLVAKDMGKPLAPSRIHFVSALPKTRNAKVMRRVIRSAYLGEDAGDLSALENPNAVEEIKRLSQD